MRATGATREIPEIPLKRQSSQPPQRLSVASLRSQVSGNRRGEVIPARDQGPANGRFHLKAPCCFLGIQLPYQLANEAPAWILKGWGETLEALAQLSSVANHDDQPKPAKVLRGRKPSLAALSPASPSTKTPRHQFKQAGQFVSAPSRGYLGAVIGFRLPGPN